MSVLHPNLDLGRSLQAVKEAGAAFIPHALSEPFREELQREIQDGPFERLPDQIGPVRQEADLFVITDAMTAYPTLTRLRAAFVTRLRQDSPQLAGLTRWWPNEAYVQRYEPGALGVSPPSGQQTVRRAGCHLHHRGQRKVRPLPDPSRRDHPRMGGRPRQPRPPARTGPAEHRGPTTVPHRQRASCWTPLLDHLPDEPEASLTACAK
jgi:hypothetical protein